MKKIAAMIVLAAILFSLNSCIGIKVELADGLVFLPVSPENVPFDDAAGGGRHRHFFDPEDGDSVKLTVCAFEGCEAYGRPVEEGEFLTELSSLLNFKDEMQRISYFCSDFLNEMERVERYDNVRHAFSKTSPLFYESSGAYSKMAELNDFYDYASDVMNASYIFFLKDADTYSDVYHEAKGFYSAVKTMRSEIEIEIYDSAYKEYVFRAEDGWTESRLDAEIETARISSDDKAVELKTNITNLLDEVAEIPNPASSDKIPEYMAKIVAANNEYARCLGYDDYFEYSLDKGYSRGYSASDVDKFIELVKEYFTPLLWSYHGKYSYMNSHGYSDTSAIDGSVFTNRRGCAALYSFLKEIEKIQDGGTSYYRSANSSLLEGRTVEIKNKGYVTAFTTYFKSISSPVICLSADYANISSFIHEHGHSYSYLTDPKGTLSLDVNEIQSQAAELLYASYLNGCPEYFAAKDAVNVKALFSAVTTLINGATCSEFEKILYTGDAGGLDDPEGRFADGITSDEYDYLYKCILGEYDIAHGMETYWRVTVPAHPCYYLSYSVSMIPSLELYVLSENEGFETAVKAYLSLFGLHDDDAFEARNVSDIEFACSRIGIGSPFDEEAFASLSAALTK